MSSLRPRFLLGALAAASFLVAQRIFSVSRNYPKQLRIQAGAEIEKSGTFKDFGTKYRDLISQQILLRTDINFLIERDVQEMGYAAFMEKHANPDCKQALIDTLELS